MGTKQRPPAIIVVPEVQTSALDTTTTQSTVPVDVIPPPPGGGSWRWDGAAWLPNTAPPPKPESRLAGTDPITEPEVNEASATM